MRILAFAYACEPGKGSEPEAGWLWSRMLARFAETWVITRTNNREAIEAELHGTRERDRLHFVYVDLPPWSRGWKRGQRGIRAYYLLWQLAALNRARSLHRSEPFDLVWHLTLANAWLGSAAAFLGPPFVYGPVGGGVSTPRGLLPILGLRGLALDTVRSSARAAARYCNPLARLAWRRARVILAQNPETRGWLPRRHRDKAVILPHATVESAAVKARKQRPRGETAVFAGRLIEWKGAALAIRTVASLPDWELLLVGSGPDETRLRRIARGSGAEGRVRFLGRLSRNELHDIMRNRADVFLFPSLHDDSPLVVVEAAACGLPVVCLGVGGPPLLGGRPVPPSTPRRTVRALARALQEAAGAAPASTASFSMDARAATLRPLLAAAGLLVGPQAEDRRAEVG